MTDETTEQDKIELAQEIAKYLARSAKEICEESGCTAGGHRCSAERWGELLAEVIGRWER